MRDSPPPVRGRARWSRSGLWRGDAELAEEAGSRRRRSPGRSAPCWTVARAVISSATMSRAATFHRPSSAKLSAGSTSSTWTSPLLRSDGRREVP